MRRRFPLALVVWQCVLAPAAWSQASTGSITGVVSDPTNARIPGVVVEMSNLDTQVALRATTTETGEYTIPLLQPGRYRLTATANGFRSSVLDRIPIDSGRVARVDIVMELGQVQEKMEVTGAAPLLESETSTLGQFIENKTVTDMPLNGRRVGDLLALVGNAIWVTGDVIRPRVFIGGGRADEQQLLIDGVNGSAVTTSQAQAEFNPAMEATQEMRILQNNYAAEYGNSGAGVVTITTKSGTNTFHGAAYEFLQNDALNARNFFAATMPPLRWNVFGVSAGGPIRKNRTFFFAHNEWQKQRIGNVRRFSVPTELERTGNFSRTTNAAGALVPIYDWSSQTTVGSKTTRNQFPGNIIPSSRQDPLGAKLASFYPLPNATPTNAAGANNFNANDTTALNITTLTTKVDHILNEKNRLSYRLILNNFPTSVTVLFPVAAADAFANTTARRSISHMFNYIRNITPNMISDLRLNLQSRFYNFYPPGQNAGWPKELGLNGVSGLAFPYVTASSYVNVGYSNDGRLSSPIRDTNIVENVSKFTGAHSFKFGGEIRLVRIAQDDRTLESGQLIFSSLATGLPGTSNTGSAIASMLTGFPNEGLVNDPDYLDRRMQYYALFAQDDWKIKSNFTLNMGVRWEAHTPRLDANNRQNGFDFAQINPVSGTPGVMTFAGLNGQPRNVYNGDWNNVAPRIGLAWKPRPNSRVVVRAGYGIFYVQPWPGEGTTTGGFGSQGDWSTPDNGITPPFLLRNGFPAPSRAALGPAFGAVPLGQNAKFSPEILDENRPLGYAQMWNLSIQREVGWNTVMEVAYAANVGHKLLGARTMQINQVPPELMGPGNAQARRPYPQFGNINVVNRMWTNSSYHSMNLRVEKRFSSGLNFLANYTLSKFIDDVPAGYEVGGVSVGMQNYYDRRAEKSLSGNDARHRFVASALYELPVGKGRRWLTGGLASAMLGGWNLGTIVTLQAGSPMALVTQVNTTNAFTPGPQRVNLLRDATLPESQRTIQRWFDTGAAVAPAPYTFGTAGRAALIGPGLANVNVSVLKNHHWRERFNIQFRLEAFNAFNRVNLGEPGGALGSPTFGVISSSAAARILQLGLRFEF